MDWWDSLVRNARSMYTSFTDYLAPPPEEKEEKEVDNAGQDLFERMRAAESNGTEPPVRPTTAESHEGEHAAYNSADMVNNRPFLGVDPVRGPPMSPAAPPGGQLQGPVGPPHQGHVSRSSQRRKKRNVEARYVPVEDGFITTAGNRELGAKYGNVAGASSSGNAPPAIPPAENQGAHVQQEMVNSKQAPGWTTGGGGASSPPRRGWHG